jgi:hypothetical protein
LTKFRTFEDADGSTEVVDPSGGLKGGSDHRGGRDEIVSEGVVEVALWFGDKPKSYDIFGSQPESSELYPVGQTYLKLENVLNTIKLLLEPAESGSLAIECRKKPVRLHWKVFGGNRVGTEL